MIATVFVPVHGPAEETVLTHGDGAKARAEMPAVSEPVRRTVPGGKSRFAGQKIHFVGIGGCGMAGLAKVLLDAGAIISGSDPAQTPRTLELAKSGATVSARQDGNLLDEKVDLVVRTAAVPSGNPEVVEARRLGIDVCKYAELLGQVMAERLGVAIAGTHGKTTTTSMLAHALLAAGRDPSFVVGATVPQLGGGSRSGNGPAFVAEACEYDRSFHHLRPKVSVITNIEADHLDCYGSLENIKAAFTEFARLTPPDGVIIGNADDAHSREALADLEGVTWVGLKGEWSWKNAGSSRGCWQATITKAGNAVGEVKLGVAGAYNLQNATMALAAADACGLDPATAARHLSDFKGADRRMTHVGTFNGAHVVDDYGHHPTEIRVTLDALRQHYCPRRLVCVFQPHQHSRTRHMLAEFARAFDDAETVILPDVYSVRDDLADRFVGSGQLAEAIGGGARHIAEFVDVVKYLRETVISGDLVVTMGAGDVYRIANSLVKLGGEAMRQKAMRQ